MRGRYFLTTIKSNGFYNTAKILLSGYLKINKFIVFYKNLENPFNWSVPMSDVEFHKISLEDLRLLRKERKKLPIQFFCDISHNFSTPYIAYIQGQLAAIDWVVYPGEYSRFLDLKENDVELNYNAVLPKFQGKGLSKLLKALIIKDCIQMGRKRMFVVVNVENIPQYKLLIRLGFEPVEVVTHFGWSRPKATLKFVK